MKTKYIIKLLIKSADEIISGLLDNAVYVYKYRSHYEYLETAWTSSFAKTYATYSSAKKAASNIMEIYSMYSEYEIIKITQ